MAQRQFRSDDTSKWLEGYGNATQGDVAPAGSTTDDQPNAACTGTEGQTTLPYSSLSGSLADGDILFIVQAHGTGATTEPNWELNKIMSFDGSNITLKYPLTRNYSSGAQVYVLRQHLNWTLDDGANINVRAFNGTIGGYFVRLARNKIYIDSGTITGQALGFNGGRDESAIGNVQAQAGASPSSNSNPQQTSANGAGGGGARDGGGGQGASGGGAGNAVAGASGGTPGGHTPGAAGSSISKSEGKILTMGPAGGGGIGPGGNDNGGWGGDGGTVVVLIAPDIEVTSNANINISGEQGNTDGNPGGSQGSGGGGGASGDFLAKGITVAIGSARVNNNGGAGGGSNSGNPAGGAGSRGYGHIDYVKTQSGSLASGAHLTTRQDTTMVHPSGAFINIM